MYFLIHLHISRVLIECLHFWLLLHGRIRKRRSKQEETCGSRLQQWGH